MWTLFKNNQKHHKVIIGFIKHLDCLYVCGSPRSFPSWGANFWGPQSITLQKMELHDRMISSLFYSLIYGPSLFSGARAWTVPPILHFPSAEALLAITPVTRWVLSSNLRHPGCSQVSRTSHFTEDLVGRVLLRETHQKRERAGTLLCQGTLPTLTKSLDGNCLCIYWIYEGIQSIWPSAWTHSSGSNLEPEAYIRRPHQMIKGFVEMSEYRTMNVV